MLPGLFAHKAPCGRGRTIFVVVLTIVRHALFPPRIFTSENMYTLFTNSRQKLYTKKADRALIPPPLPKIDFYCILARTHGITAHTKNRTDV